ncbi:hypothetical protein [Zavarzinella formosa]|uniref:hypothetical protein n=1 Tax=Zavarzinella formosa TaxID=360055 RepID=UPI0003154252|nr:hypothetical protein [Zavarzinella formosa]
MEQVTRWEWGNEGVAFEDGHLLWYEKEGASRFASGAACEQTFDKFLENGPQYDGVPPEILSELTKAVHRHMAEAKPKKPRKPK